MIEGGGIEAMFQDNAFTFHHADAGTRLLFNEIVDSLKIRPQQGVKEAHVAALFEQAGFDVVHFPERLKAIFGRPKDFNRVSDADY